MKSKNLIAGLLFFASIFLIAAYDPTAVSTVKNNNFAAGYTNTFTGFLELPEVVPGGIVTKSNRPYFGTFGFSSNLFWGYATGNSNSTAKINIAIGTFSMSNLVSGTGFNIAVGNGSQQILSSGSENISVGHLTLNSLTTGTRNLAIGNLALRNLVSNGGNAAAGYQALTSCTGSDNTAFGNGAGASAIGGSSSCYFGKDAGGGITTGGPFNVFIGYAAGGGGQLVSATNTVVIGANTVSLAHDALILGNNNHNVGIHTNAPRAHLDVNGNVLFGANGATIKGILSNTAVLDFDSALVLGTQQSKTITVTGASTNDSVEVGYPIDFGTAAADSTWFGYVSAVNTVTIVRTGIAATAVYTNKTWRATVTKF